MFRKARIKLTAWYLLIIMLVSMLFSIAVYEALTLELDRVDRMHSARVELGIPELRSFPRNSRLDPELIEESKNRLKIMLGIINFVILGTSSVAGYFLAGRTLKPISDMVEEQNRFITDSSHELRTPLTSLKTEIEVGLRDEKLNFDEAKKLLKSNLEEVNNLQRLSDELIKLTQYQKSSNGLQFMELSLRTVVDEACKKTSKLAKNKNIEITKKIEEVNINGDEPSLTELLVIILENAIKYSPEKTKIKLVTEKSDHQISISISDQGVGIEEEDLPHIFDRFYRSSKSRSKNETPGYGLGLSIAKQIVEKHHGSIVAESEIKKGTKISVSLPIS